MIVRHNVFRVEGDFITDFAKDLFSQGGAGGSSKTPEQIAAEEAAKAGADAEAAQAAKDAEAAAAAKAAEEAAKAAGGAGAEETEIEINGVLHKVDKDGNALDANGKVVYSKQQIEEAAKAAGGAGGAGGEGKPKTFIEELINRHKFSKEGVAYSDDDEGLDKWLHDYAENIAKSSDELMLKKMPKLRGYAEYLQRNPDGNEIDYFNRYVKNDFTSFELNDKTTEDDKLSWIKRDLMLNNAMAEAEADEMAKLIKAGGNFEEKAKASLSRLKTYNERQAQAEEEANRQQEEKSQQVFNKVLSTVKAGSLTVEGLGKITIPDAERQQFIDYITKYVGDTERTQADIDASSQSIDLALLTDYMRFKKFSIPTLIQQLVADANSKSLSERRAAYRKLSIGTGASSDDKGADGKSIEKFITLDNLI